MPTASFSPSPIVGMGIACAFLRSPAGRCWREMGDGGPEAVIGAQAQGRRRGGQSPRRGRLATAEPSGVRPGWGTLGDHAGVRLAVRRTRCGAAGWRPAGGLGGAEFGVGHPVWRSNPGERGPPLVIAGTGAA